MNKLMISWNSWISGGCWSIDKGVTETIQNAAKEQKGEFFGMLLGTLGVSFLGNLLSGKGVMSGTNRAGQDF